MNNPLRKPDPVKRGRGRPRSKPADTDNSTVQALDRGLTLLELLAREGAANLTDLSLQAGMPAPTAYRLLNTLHRHQFAQFNDTNQEWSVGVQAYSVGCSYLARTSLVELARPIMQSLMSDTGETANLAVVDDGDVVFISQVEATHPIRAFHQPGSRSHIHASGIGKALLCVWARSDIESILEKKGLPAFTDKTLSSPRALFDDLARTAQRGWSFDDEERYEGMRCVAAPIIDASGEPLAGVSVSGPTIRLPDERISALGPLLKQAAHDISLALGAKDALLKSALG